MSDKTQLELTNSKLLQKDKSPSSDAKDFLRGATYGAIQTPIDGLTQFANNVSPLKLPHLQLVSAPTNDSFFASAGQLTGAVIDFALLQKGLNVAAPNFFAAQATTPVWLKAGATGAAFQFMMPTSENGNYFLNKSRDLAIGFGTFAAMGAVTEHFAPDLAKSFIGRVEAGAEGGLAGGTAEVALKDLLYMKTPKLSDLGTIGKYTAFGAMMGAANYLEEDLQSKWKDYKLQKSIETNQNIFNEAGDKVVTAQKQLYNVRFRKVSNPEGESIPTLENPGGEAVAPGQWVAQRLDANGQVVIERGQPNQWPINEAKIPKTYNVSAETLATQTEFVAPTRVDGPPVHVVSLQEPLKIRTPWGRMNAETGDWLANYDFNAALNLPGKDYAIISNTSFNQTYQAAG